MLVQLKVKRIYLINKNMSLKITSNKIIHESMLMIALKLKEIRNWE